ncbi:hypothetical protein C1632_12975 [Microbacterium testaceum]|uniref:RCC1 domain-containing protein n=1 Tax=Microbacterium testaceum TaxID=2033 RepID=UPI000CCDB76E|nr:hypothetical protein [Microbacterium testaceum]PNW08717.1 hypothetical protein C1632_12975 [Microbacterium testaceum]
MRPPTHRRFGLFTARKLLATTLIVVAVAGVISPTSATGAWFTDAKSVPGNSLTSATLDAPRNFRNTWSSSSGNTLSWDSATSQAWATANNVTSGITYRVTRHVGSYPARDLYTGSDTSFTDPNPRGRNLRYSQVSAGQKHTLAIDENGYIWAWGYNGKGAFGDGTTTSTDTPQKTVLPTGRTAIQIATGNMWSAALLDDGTVWTWGYNVGNLGIGNTDNQVLPQLVEFPNGVRITSLGQILGDSQTMFVIDQNGAVWDWGMNDRGQLGDGSTNNTTRPHVIPDLRVRYLSSMGAHVIAEGTDGSVWSWGDGSDGQVGDHRYQQRLTPYRVAMPSAAGRVEQVSSGGTYSVVLDSNGAIWMWGSIKVGASSQLDPTAISTPRLPSGVQAAQVATGPDMPTANPSYFIPSVLIGLSNGAMLQYDIDDDNGVLRYNLVLDGHFITELSVGGAERVARTTDQSTSGLYFWTISSSGKQSDAGVVWSPVICPYMTRKASDGSCVWDGQLSYSVDYQYGPWRSDYSGLVL